MIGVVAGIAFKVKIRVVGHIYNRRFVCFRFVLNIDGIIVRQFHQHFTSDVSRKTFFTVCCTVSQLQFLRIQQFGIKHPVLESLRSAVQTMTVVIAGKLIFYTIQSELSANPDGVLRSGSTGQILIPNHADNVILIPQKATYEVQDRRFVYVLNDSNKTVSTPITVSPLDDGQNYVVTSGLQPGQRVVVEGIGTKVRPDMEIKPVDAAQKAAAQQPAQ